MVLGARQADADDAHAHGAGRTGRLMLIMLGRKQAYPDDAPPTQADASGTPPP